MPVLPLEVIRPTALSTTSFYMCPIPAPRQFPLKLLSCLLPIPTRWHITSVPVPSTQREPIKYWKTATWFSEAFFSFSSYATVSGLLALFWPPVYAAGTKLRSRRPEADRADVGRTCVSEGTAELLNWPSRIYILFAYLKVAKS